MTKPTERLSAKQSEEAYQLVLQVFKNQPPDELIPLVIFLLKAIKGEIPEECLNEMITEYETAFRAFLDKKDKKEIEMLKEPEESGFDTPE